MTRLIQITAQKEEARQALRKPPRRGQVRLLLAAAYEIAEETTEIKEP